MDGFLPLVGLVGGVIGLAILLKEGWKGAFGGESLYEVYKYGPISTGSFVLFVSLIAWGFLLLFIARVDYALDPSYLQKVSRGMVIAVAFCAAIPTVGTALVLLAIYHHRRKRDNPREG